MKDRFLAGAIFSAAPASTKIGEYLHYSYSCMIANFSMNGRGASALFFQDILNLNIITSSAHTSSSRYWLRVYEE